MKNKKYIYLVISLVIVFFFIDSNVYAVDDNCKLKGENGDICTVKEYFYDSNGNAKDYKITLGIYHNKEIMPSLDNAETIVSFDDCEGVSTVGECANRFQIPSTVYIDVDSDTSVFPIAICAHVNETVRNDNYQNYIYFTDDDITAAIASGYCVESEVYYSEKKDSSTKATISCDDKTKLTTFSYSRDLTGLTFSTVSQDGRENGTVCRIYEASDSKQYLLYDDWNSDVTCNSSSYFAECQYVYSGTYSCSLYSCKDGITISNSTNTDTDDAEAKECTLTNIDDSSDKIVYTYEYSLTDFGDGSKYHYDYITKNGISVSQSMRYGPGVFQDYAEAKSCPAYIYYDSTDDTYVILNSATLKDLYDKENEKHDVVTYKFMNSSDTNETTIDFSCSYTSTVDNLSLSILTTDYFYSVTYPTGNAVSFLKSVADEAGLSMPDSSCGDVYYILSVGKIVTADSSTLSELCQSYTSSDIYHFCTDSGCNFEEDTCLDAQKSSGDCPSNIAPAFKILKKIVMPLIQIGVPIILILIGSIDLTRAVVASDDKGLKDATSRLIKRFLAAIIIFFAVTIVGIIMNAIANSGISDTSAWKACWTDLDD